jgi:acid phosphatase family membrane protein YuiD
MLFSAAAVLTGWYVGLAIAAVVIAIVVVLVAMILGLARRIGYQARAIEEALDEARVNTFPLWDVEKVNDGVRSITKGAGQARAALGGGK